MSAYKQGRELLAAATPRLRGWLHATVAPLSVAAGIVLVALAGSPQARVACAVYAVTAAALFGVSALYHRGRWSPPARALFRRLDHANIFLIIAGTYTPFTVLLLDGPRQRILLWTIWAGALTGVAFRLLWLGAPRWLYTPVYVALGWTAVFFLPDFAATGGVAVLVLILVGGAIYSAGGIVYALRRPNPSPRWFGFHEIFHSCTVAAYVVHYVAVSLTAYTAAA